MDNEIRRMIIRKASVEEIIQYGREKKKMRTLKESGLELIRQGVTTPEELMKVSYEM